MFFNEIADMRINEVFAAMRAQGLAKSQMEFSRIWLGRSPRYYSHLIAMGQEPGIATLCALSWRLGQIAASLKGDQRQTLLYLQQVILGHVEHRAVTDLRHRSTNASGCQGAINSVAVKEPLADYRSKSL